MDAPETSPGAVGGNTSPRQPSRLATAPRRMLHRVETAALDLRIGVRLGPEVTRGHLLNISGGGCSVRVPLPLTLVLDTGMVVDVILPVGESELTYSGELVGLNMGKGAVSLRLRFRVLTPEKRRALLSVIGELVTRDFQLRHTGGNRAWSATNRP
ncbi:MAG TPA: PilZ domain-containing protein [Chloroflexota bacterium]|nr:PilZ domain-containing protein [Chloroflexota bacterium]